MKQILFITTALVLTFASISAQPGTTFSDTVKPLNDLGAGTYRGFAGGLYPNGVNTPSRPIRRPHWPLPGKSSPETRRAPSIQPTA